MREYDDFDDPKANGFLDSIGLKAAFFIVLIALSFMIGLVWKIYSGGSDGSNDVPIVRAESDPFKTRPDDPGGEEVRFKDSTIFADGDPDRRVENLLAEDTTEQPLPRSQLFAGLNTEEAPEIQENLEETVSDQPVTEDEEQVLSYAEQAEEVVDNLNEEGVEAIQVTEEAVEQAAQEVVEEAPVIESKPEVAPAPKPTPQPQPIAPSVTSGDYIVQLVSVTSESAAEAEWGKQVQKYGALIEGLPHRVQRADLGDKGIYYRVQAGPMSKSNADDLCSKIKQTNPNGCLVRKK